jgi:hypothetical protein
METNQKEIERLPGFEKVDGSKPFKEHRVVCQSNKLGIHKKCL